MIAHLLMVGMLWSAQHPNVNSARQGFSACLGTLLRGNLRERVVPDAFESSLAQACKAEEAAFRHAVVTQAVAAGASRAAAEQNAQFEITDMIDNTKQRYRDYVETNTEPR